MLRFDTGRFPPTPAACYQAPWRLPGPDFHRQADTSLFAGHLNPITSSHLEVPASLAALVSQVRRSGMARPRAKRHATLAERYDGLVDPSRLLDDDRRALDDVPDGFEALLEADDADGFVVQMLESTADEIDELDESSTRSTAAARTTRSSGG